MDVRLAESELSSPRSDSGVEEGQVVRWSIWCDKILSTSFTLGLGPPLCPAVHLLTQWVT